MGWNKQSGDAWVLQRHIVRVAGEPQPEKMLDLKTIGPLTIEDADALMRALHAEIVAARKSEGTKLFIREKLGIEMQPWQQEIVDQVSYGSSVLQNWDVVLGPEPKVPPADLEDDDGCPND